MVKIDKDFFYENCHFKICNKRYDNEGIIVEIDTECLKDIPRKIFTGRTYRHFYVEDNQILSKVLHSDYKTEKRIESIQDFINDERLILDFFYKIANEYPSFMNFIDINPDGPNKYNSVIGYCVCREENIEMTLEHLKQTERYKKALFKWNLKQWD